MRIINSDKMFYDYLNELKEKYDKHKYLRVDVKTGKQRSDKQRKALEVFCKLVAEDLNSQGITFTQFFKPGFEVPWSQEIVKDNVWRPIQKTITGFESTTKPKRGEYIEIYEFVNNKLANYCIHVPWPCKESAK